MDLKEYLLRENMTMTEMAKILDIHYQYLWMIITGRRTPGLRLAKDIELLTKGEIRAEQLISPLKHKVTCPTCGRKQFADKIKPI